MRGAASPGLPAPRGLRVRPRLPRHKWNQSCPRGRRNLRHGRIIASIIFLTLLGASGTILPSSLRLHYSGSFQNSWVLKAPAGALEFVRRRKLQLPGPVVQASPVIEVEGLWEPRGPEVQSQALHLTFIRCFIVYKAPSTHILTPGITLEHSCETSYSTGPRVSPLTQEGLQPHRVSRTF